jgi:hypothetical protein
MLARLLPILLVLGLLGGCVSSRVQTGAAYGAIAGVAAGGAVGVLITDEDLLGSDANASTGDTSVPTGGGIAASLAIGAVVGAVVGAMVGHRRDDRYADIEVRTGEIEVPMEGLEDEDGAEEAAARNPYVSF